jgi:Raf kinase inhibitor-like YbhB/YbcL family protein
MALKLTSSAFRHGEPIPTRHTADGADRSPPLAWTGVPDRARTLVLLVDDPDAPTAQPWVHWVLYNLPADVTHLPEGLPRRLVLDDPAAYQGRNSFPRDNLGYRGPAPPPGHGVHRYRFRLHALDRRLDLRPGAARDRVEREMNPRLITHTELLATYKRPG